VTHSEITATMASSAAPPVKGVELDKKRPRPGWEKLLVDVDGQDKWRWVHPDEDTVEKHSSIHTHYAVDEVSEEGDASSSSGTSSADEAARDSKRQKMLTLPSPAASVRHPRSPVPKKSTPPPKPARVNDGLYANCQACDRKKKLKVVECPCEHSQRAALTKLLLRNQDDPAYRKYFDTVSNAVKMFDTVSNTADGTTKDDDDDAAEQLSIKLRCPHCDEDLFLCTQTPFSKEDDPFK
jgi:hypothetical protein